VPRTLDVDQYMDAHEAWEEWEQRQTGLAKALRAARGGCPHEQERLLGANKETDLGRAYTAEEQRLITELRAELTRAQRTDRSSRGG